MGWFRNLDVLLTVQRSATPFLDSVMRGISFLGSEFFYFAVLLFLYWSGRRKPAIHLACTVLLSLYASFLLKELFHLPRPAGAGLRVLETVEDFSFPSGHAQSTASFWFFLAFSSRKPSVFLLGGTIVFLVALSRLYLGVHYLEDVLFGALFGFGLAFGFRKLLSLAAQRKVSLPYALVLLGLLSTVLFVASPSPLAVKTSGALSGTLLGYLLARWLGFPERPLVPGEYLLGAGTVALVYLGGKMLPLPHEGWLWVRYLSLTFSATFLFPGLLHSLRHDSRRHSQLLP